MGFRRIREASDASAWASDASSKTNGTIHDAKFPLRGAIGIC